MLGLLTFTCSVVCLLPQAYSNKLRLAALDVPGFISLWCLGAQRKGMVINMRVMQSFLMFFYILDQCYEQCPENDLGGFLGSISPELWGDGKPMDKAVYNDWKAQQN